MACGGNRLVGLDGALDVDFLADAEDAIDNRGIGVGARDIHTRGEDELGKVVTEGGNLEAANLFVLANFDLAFLRVVLGDVDFG